MLVPCSGVGIIIIMYTCNYMHNYNYASHNVLLNCQTSKVFCCGTWGGGGGGGGGIHVL